MDNARELYNALFNGIAFLLPYDSFDPMSPPSILETLREVIEERDQLETDLESMRNERNDIQSLLDDTHVETIEPLLRYKKLWEGLKSQLELYKESAEHLGTSDIPHRTLDLMATFERTFTDETED